MDIFGNFTKLFDTFQDFSRLSDLKNFMNSMKYFMEKMKFFIEKMKYFMEKMKYLNKMSI